MRKKEPKLSATMKRALQFLASFTLIYIGVYIMPTPSCLADGKKGEE